MPKHLFKKGKSGNPNGRPKGSIDRRLMIAELAEHKDALFKKALDLALSGYWPALQLFMERLLPAIPRDNPLSQAAQLIGSLDDKGKKVFELLSNGEITPLEGHLLLQSLAAQAKIAETAELVKNQDRVIDVTINVTNPDEIKK